MVELKGVFRQLDPQNILVIGDLMLDAYVYGSINRISPEAPVPVLHVAKEEQKAGGAGNVLLNLKAMGAHVFALGRVGNDATGKELIDSLTQANIDTTGILIENDYQTPLKKRILAANQQLLRVDHETAQSVSKELEKALIEKYEELLESVNLVAISDYGKGLLSHAFLKAITQKAKAKNIPVIVDPKGKDFSKYRGATLIKPNYKETLEASGFSEGDCLQEMAKELIQETQVQHLLVTRSKEGMSLFDANFKQQDFPVRQLEVNDVTGAGDTVLATICYALANHIPIEQSVALANLAAGIAIEHIGCATVTLGQLAKRMLELDASNKIFDPDHLFALKEALKEAPFTLLALKDTQELSADLFEQMQILSQKGLLVLSVSSSSNLKFLSLLASLQEVEFIVVGDATNSLKPLVPIESLVYSPRELV